MTHIIHFSRFVPVTVAGGGARRTRQVVELLESLSPEMVSAGRVPGLRDYSPVDLGFGKGVSLHYYSGKDGNLRYWSTIDLEAEGSVEKKAPILTKIKNFLRNKNNDKLWGAANKRKIKRFRDIAEEWARRIDLSRLSLAIVDDPVYFQPLIEKLKENGIPVVAVSHNIESLGFRQMNRRYRQQLFEREVEALAACDVVVTIAREEAWLLEKMGINAIFFPYYPVEGIAKRLSVIREKRRKTKKRDFLLVGSAINEPTRQGMLAVIDCWKRQELVKEGDRLLVAGYKSDVYLKEIGLSGTEIDVLGPLPDEELDKVMGTVKAVIVYQEWGSGALTRIMEALTAGVPVLVNTHGARSYHNLDGVIEFHDLDELGTAINKIEKTGGQVPLPPAPDPGPVVAAILRLRRASRRVTPLKGCRGVRHTAPSKKFDQNF